jgi:hypothetical protein
LCKHRIATMLLEEMEKSCTHLVECREICYPYTQHGILVCNNGI